MQITFDHSTNESSTIRTFWFKPPKPLDYTAGQYIELTLRHSPTDDRGEKRWFTLSSAPNQPLISITTRYAGERQSSTYKNALFALQPGATLDLAGPMGDFVLPKDVNIPLIFVAGGIGITPFHSMLAWLADQKQHRPISLMWGIRTEDDIIFQDTFDRANIHATIVVSDPSGSWGGERGQLTGSMIAGLAPLRDNTLIYLAGPEPMTEALANDMLRSGIKRHQLVTDYFPGYTKF